MRLTIIGENCWDYFKYGKVSRLNPEAPTPILNPISVTKNVGMAANVVENLKSLGAETRLVTNKEKIEKIRFVDQKSNYILLREDRNDKVSNSFKIDEVDWGWPDAIVISDYDKGFLTLQNILDISKRHKLTFLDTKKPLNIDYMGGYSFIKINEGEWENSKEKGNSLHEWQHKLIVTLSERGAMYMGMNFPPSDTQQVKDISGAGDTFLAALAFKYVETKDISQSITFANKCSGEVVKRKGVSVI